MAKNMIFKYTENKTRVRTLATADINAGTPLLDPADQRPAVTVTATGNLTKTITAADNPLLVPLGGRVTSITFEDGSPGHADNEATLAYDGTWEFTVTGATTATAQGVQVYITSGGALTTTSSGNTAYGRVDYPTDYYKRNGVLPVRLGS